MTEQPENVNATRSTSASPTQIDALISSLLLASTAIRYVAFYVNGKVISQQRSAIASASATSSDYYEEVLVNPTLLTLAGQRGDLDCGGLRFIVIAYGNFSQIVSRFDNGHVSISIENSADPIAQQALAQSIIVNWKLALTIVTGDLP